MNWNIRHVKEESSSQSKFTISTRLAPVRIGGQFRIEHRFLFMTDDIQPKRPNSGFFMAESELDRTFVKALLFHEQSEADRRLTFKLVMARKDFFDGQTRGPGIDRHWAKMLWAKCQIGQRAAYEGLIQDASSILQVRPDGWIQFDEEEKMFLTIGMLWAYWEAKKPSLRLKEKAADIHELSGRQISASNLWKQFKGAGFIPLSPEEESEVSKAGPLFRDFAIESLLGRKMKGHPRANEIITEMLMGCGDGIDE